MNNLSIDLESAKTILSTYREVHDTPPANNDTGPGPGARSSLQRKNKELQTELNELKEKYLLLQRELINRNKKLEHLSQDLTEKTIYMEKLREDFEHALYQLAQRK